MKLKTVKLKNFRCFGDDPVIVDFENDLTTLIGSNGSGKSAVLASLVKAFGPTRSERSLVKSDFHIDRSTDSEVDTIELSLSYIFEFPELTMDEVRSSGIPSFYHYIIQDQETGLLRLEARLDAIWTAGVSAEGDIEQSLKWIVGYDSNGNEKTIDVISSDRSRIVVYYIPASRDPVLQMKQTASSMLYRYLKSVSWSEETKSGISEISSSIDTLISGEAGIQSIVSKVSESWNVLINEGPHSKFSIRPVSRDLSEIIKNVNAIFTPSDSVGEDGIDMLSDGQKSLFYISLVSAILRIQKLITEGASHGLDSTKIPIPALTMLAIEEPENHVSPHYLGRIIKLCNEIAESEVGQVVLTSHSASILARIDPVSVRHLFLQNRNSSVSKIELPDSNSEAEKFIREAVRAYPELYFSKLVILGEGDSEKIVIPRIIKAVKGIDIDTNLISFVPLGGRHVNHLWRLLNSLKIPYVTLLDLDLGRSGAGWMRIKYAYNQLDKVEESVLSEKDRNTLDQIDDSWSSDYDEDIISCIDELKSHNVFFSKPLDLDYLMLHEFFSEYTQLEYGENGPRESTSDVLASAVLGDSSPAEDYYHGLGNDYLLWYRYLFKGRGKPVTHVRALNLMSDAEIRESCPRSLKCLVDRVTELLSE